jgi:enoyl-CoA hydratase/carnithine racemase
VLDVPRSSVIVLTFRMTRIILNVDDGRHLAAKPAAVMPAAAFELHDRLGEIVIDNPPLNLFSADLIADLHSAAEQAAASEARAVLFRAEGDAFSAGADVSIFAGLDEDAATALMTDALSLIAAIEGIPVPTVALVHGRCFAGALEVALACDLIWAAAGTQIGQLEAVIGGIPFAGGTQRLASRIGAARTARLVYGASIHPAEELAGWGLVSHVTAPERLLEEGRTFGARLAAGPTVAHRATKRVLRAWRSGGVSAADEVTLAEGPAVILSRDLQEGIASLQRSGPGHATFAGR